MNTQLSKSNLLFAAQPLYLRIVSSPAAGRTHGLQATCSALLHARLNTTVGPVIKVNRLYRHTQVKSVK